MPAPPIVPPERPDLYVVARFLDRLRETNTPWTRSRLQRAVRVNYDIFRSYLALLQEKGFVEEVDPPEESDARSGVLRLTPAGHAAHGRLVVWIRDVFGDTRL